MRNAVVSVGLLVSLVVSGCICRQPARVREYTYHVWCYVNDEQCLPVPEACLFYGFNMPEKERQSYGGATMCQMAVADQNGRIKTHIVRVKDSGPILKRWGDLSTFIIAPGRAPVVWEGQSEVVLVKADEFEGVYDGINGACPYTRFKGSDPFCRVPLEKIEIDLDSDVVTQGQGTGSCGEIERRLAYFRKYMDRGCPFLKREGDKLIVYAVCDAGYWLAKRLSALEEFDYGTCRGPQFRKVKARDHLEIRINPEDLSGTEFHTAK